MALTSLFRSRSDHGIRWNDIEALPIYAAIALCFTCLVFALLDNTPTIHAVTLKLVGIVGGLALRHAWLKLDEQDEASVNA